MNYLIRQCRENFGPPPRLFPDDEYRQLIHMDVPSWVSSNPQDDLSIIFIHYEELVREGIVVWGHIVQANVNLFRPGPENLPAEVVFPVDERDDLSPKQMAAIAHQLFQLKHTTPTEPELAKLADSITNEYARPFGFEVPALLTQSVPCRMSVTYIDRQLLPVDYLAANLIPYLVLPRDPYVAQPLPQHYWADDLRKLWKMPG